MNEPPDPHNQQQRLAYKLDEAAALLGVSVPTIRRAIQRGLIKPSRAFRHVLISSAELQRFIDTTSVSREGENRLTKEVRHGD